MWLIFPAVSFNDQRSVEYFIKRAYLKPVFLFCVYLSLGSSAMSLLSKTPRFLRNIYVLTFIGYLIWMLFLDANNIPNQLQTRVKLARLVDEKEYYQEKILEVNQDREELLSDEALLEKFAREKYLMRKPKEDVYVIVEENEK